ncbi:MAG TPA: HIT family protein [Micromonosporaceae bacterium]|nr:HIT family protein [Micromonosporaceae bacterium]
MAEGRCAFCEIVRGDLPSSILFEDGDTMAFLDITAVTEGHTLVIPKRHVTDLWEAREDDAVAVMRTVHRMAHRIREVLRPNGLTLFQANRPAGWQDVFHLHVHLVPRNENDRLHRPWQAEPVELETLEPMRSRLAVPNPGLSCGHRRISVAGSRP